MMTLSRAGQLWSDEEREGVISMYNQGLSVSEIAETYGRSCWAIAIQLYNLDAINNEYHKCCIEQLKFRRDSGKAARKKERSGNENDDLHSNSFELLQEQYDKLKIKYSKSGEISIDVFNFSKRLYNALRRTNIKTIDDLFSHSFLEIVSIKNLGRTSLIELLTTLEMNKAILSNENNKCDFTAIVEQNMVIESVATRLKYVKGELNRIATTITECDVSTISGDEDLTLLSDQLIDSFKLLLENTKLTDRKRAIFCNYYGIYDNETPTLQVVGEKYGVTRERIRQIVNQCRRRIISNKIYNDYYFNSFDLIKEVSIEDLIITFAKTIPERYNARLGEILLIKLFGQTTFEMIKTTLSEYRRLYVYKNSKKSQSNDKKVRLSKEEKFINSIVFPGVETKFNDSILDLPVRMAFNSIGHSGYIKLEKSKGSLFYASDVEKKVLQLLDSFECVKEINSRCLRSYDVVSDILVKTIDDKIVLVDVQQYSDMAINHNLTKTSIMYGFCREKGYGLSIVDDRFFSIIDIFNYPYDSSIVDELKDLCRNSSVPYKFVKDFLEKRNVKLTRNAFNHMVIEEGFTLYDRPFSLGYFKTT